MPKTYLRYEPDDVYGIVSSFPGTHFDQTSKYCITAVNSYLKVQEILSQKLVFSLHLKSESSVSASQILYSQNYIAIGFANGNFQVFSLNTKEQICNFDLSSQIIQIRDLKDSVLVCLSDGSVNILDLIQQEITLNLSKWHAGWCTCAVVYKNFIISGGRDRVLNITQNGKKIQVLANFKSQIRDIITVNELCYVCCEENDIYVFSDNKEIISKIQVDKTQNIEKSTQIQELTEQSTLFVEIGKVQRKIQESVKMFARQSDKLYMMTETTIQFFNINTKSEPLRQLKEGSVYKSNEKLINISLSLEGELLVTTNKNRLLYFDKNLEEKANFTQEGHRVAPTCSALNSDDTLLMTASTEVKIWNIRKSICILTLQLQEGVRPNKCMFLPGNAYGLVATSTGVIILINLLSSDLVSMTQISDKNITHMSLYNNSLFTASEDCHIRFFTFSENFDLIQEREYEFPLPIKCALITDLYLFVSLSDNTIRVHFADSLKFRFQLYGHALPVTQMQISSTKERLFTVSLDKTIRSWGLNFGECLKIIKLDSGGRVMELQNGTHIGLVGCEDGRIRMFDLDTYTFVLELGEGRHGEDYSKGHFGAVNTLLMSKEGRFFITTGMDNRIHLWLQTQDLVSAEDEYNKRVMKQTISQEEGRKEWDNQVSVNIDDMDKLESGIEICVDPEKFKVELCGDSWEVYLMELLQKRLRREILPDLLRNLDFSRSLQLVQLLLQIIDNYKSDFAVFVILRLFRNNLQGVNGDKRVQQVSVLVREKCLKATDEYINKIDEVFGVLMIEK